MKSGYRVDGKIQPEDPLRTPGQETDQVQGRALAKEAHVPGLREPLSPGRSLMMPLRLFMSILAIGAAIGAWSGPGDKAFAEPPKAGQGHLQFLREDGSVAVSITIEVADAPEARVRGLQERWSLPELHGMIFIFDVPEVQKFWMHNTPLSLDMIFVDENRRILNMAESTTPMSKQTYSSKGPAKYVVEVKAGFSKRHGIEEGMRIQWKATPNKKGNEG